VALRLALDTNRYTDLCRGDPVTERHVAQADSVYVPFVVAAELRAGFAVGTRGQENERVLRRFLRKPGVQLLLPDEPTTSVYGALFKQLRQQGTPIPTNDLWIAALAVQHGLTLCSRDEHFRHLPQLVRV
jgi:predicted nucleic acid-binding protein